MTNTENISQNRKVARWALHETAMDVRHLAESIIRDTHKTVPWEDLTEAAAVLRQLTERLEQQAVNIARAEGYTWASIGEALSTSRQAAQQRYGA